MINEMFDQRASEISDLARDHNAGIRQQMSEEEYNFEHKSTKHSKVPEAITEQ